MVHPVIAHVGPDHVTLAPVGAVAGLGLARGALARGRVARRAPTGPGWLPYLLALAAGAVLFQVVHLAEHVLQAGYWLAHPFHPPWLTPWATVGRDLLAIAADGRPASGNELLHLVGNVVFLAGLAAGLLAVRSYGAANARLPWLRRTLWLQGLHVGEHLALTLSVFALGQAHGVSTLFGFLQPGTALAGGVRVWFHFALNLAVTVCAVRGLGEARAALDGSPHVRGVKTAHGRA